jgi:4-aminobutyrate aminotransferase-like enzyme
LSLGRAQMGCPGVIVMVTCSEHEGFSGPYVRGELPGPRSAELLARQERWESNARVYPRHLPIAIAEAGGSFVRDLDGNVFKDAFTDAQLAMLPPGMRNRVKVHFCGPTGANAVERGGRDDGVVRMMPPLNVTAEVIDTACAIPVDAVKECCPSTSSSPEWLLPIR